MMYSIDISSENVELPVIGLSVDSGVESISIGSGVLSGWSVQQKWTIPNQLTS